MSSELLQELQQYKPESTLEDAEKLHTSIEGYCQAASADYDDTKVMMFQILQQFNTLPTVVDGNFVVNVTDEQYSEMQLQNALAQPSSVLTPFDKRELQEAARQASLLYGMPERTALRKLMNLGIASGKIGRHTKMPRAREHEEKRCLNCGTLKRHQNSFCSADCCKAWKINSKVKDRNGRSIAKRQMVRVHFEDQEPREYEVVEVFPDNPTSNQPGYWIDVATEGGITCAMSYQCEILGWAE